MNKNILIDFDKIQILTNKDKKTIEHRALKLAEETGEVAEAILSSNNISACGYKNKSKDDITEECIDVIIVASSIISQNCDNKLDIDFIQDLYEKKLKKWEDKISK